MGKIGDFQGKEDKELLRVFLALFPSYFSFPTVFIN